MPYHDYLQLTWSYRGSIPIELGPRVPNNLDLCRLILPDFRFELCFAPMPLVYQPLIDNDGGYWLYILLTADEAVPRSLQVRVDCDKSQRKVSVDQSISVTKYTG
jgi:hypothetical protein